MFMSEVEFSDGILDAKLTEFEEFGFFLIEGLFTTGQIEDLRANFDDAMLRKGPGTMLEADQHTVRTQYGSHLQNSCFQNLVQEHFLTRLASKLLRDKIYVHQFKINAKAGFSGEQFHWHQDSAAWLESDGMPTENALTCMIYLDDSTALNGSLMLIPKSHKYGLFKDGYLLEQGPKVGSAEAMEWMSNLTKNMKYQMSNGTVEMLVKKHGLQIITAKAGSVLFFHSSVVHGSANNISPFKRRTILISYNGVSNALQKVKNPRPSFVASRSFEPVI